MKVAIVHDWLVNYGGAEDVVKAILEIYPQADIYTLVYDKKKMAGRFDGCKIHTSFLQKIPSATRLYTKFLKFMPKAFESFDFSDYDLVICSSSSCAKGVITPPSVPQIAYIHTPMRYAWDLFFEYRKRSGKLTQFFMNRWMSQIRLWDFVSSQRIDKITCNSNYIGRRIKKFWARDSKTIYPPVNTDFFTCNPEKREDYYIFFSRLVAYKRADIAIKACMSLGRKLVVIGGGSESKNLKKLASGNKNITFTGRISDEAVREKLQKCRALIFCAEEDFGIIPVQAQACGTPVIAYSKGGAGETVVNRKTGLLFDQQNEEACKEAILKFEEENKKGIFNPKEISEHAKKFSKERFKKEFKAACDECIESLKALNSMQ